MFTKQELSNILILMKNGIKPQELNGASLIVVGALLKKCEDLANAPEKKDETKYEPATSAPELKAPIIPSKKQKNP